MNLRYPPNGAREVARIQDWEAGNPRRSQTEAPVEKAIRPEKVPIGSGATTPRDKLCGVGGVFVLQDSFSQQAGRWASDPNGDGAEVGLE